MLLPSFFVLCSRRLPNTELVEVASCTVAVKTRNHCGPCMALNYGVVAVVGGMAIMYHHEPILMPCDGLGPRGCGLVRARWEKALLLYGIGPVFG